MVRGERKAVGVAYGAAAMVVVEVDVDILVPVPQISETTGPIGEGGPAVAGSRVRSTLVQPHISPICRPPQRGFPLRGVTEAERHSVLPQDVRHLVGVPGFVARLNATWASRRKALSVETSRAGSARKFAGSCSRVGPSFGPSPLDRARSRRTGSVGLLRRSTWVR